MLRNKVTKGIMNEISKWLEEIVRGLVSNPDEVKVTAKKDDMGVLFTVHVDPADAGKALGREGRTAKAIRTLLYTKGYAHDMRASLKFDVPELDR